LLEQVFHLGGGARAQRLECLLEHLRLVFFLHRALQVFHHDFQVKEAEFLLVFVVVIIVGDVAEGDGVVAVIIFVVVLSLACEAQLIVVHSAAVFSLFFLIIHRLFGLFPGVDLIIVVVVIIIRVIFIAIVLVDTGLFFGLGGDLAGDLLVQGRDLRHQGVQKRQQVWLQGLGQRRAHQHLANANVEESLLVFSGESLTQADELFDKLAGHVVVLEVLQSLCRVVVHRCHENTQKVFLEDKRHWVFFHSAHRQVKKSLNESIKRLGADEGLEEKLAGDSALAILHNFLCKHALLHNLGINGDAGLTQCELLLAVQHVVIDGIE